MALTPEELESRIQGLERRNQELERRLSSGGGDQRIPLLATGFDLEDAIFSPAVRVYNSGAQTIGDGSSTALTFDAERFDTDNMHSTASNTDRLTAKTAGIYCAFGSLRWANNTTGRRRLSVQLNGATDIGDIELHGPPISGHVVTMLVSSPPYALDAGDYLRLVVFQTSGGDLDTVAVGNYSPEFSMVWVAPPL